MSQIGLWHISESGPLKLAITDNLWERQLEDWIEQDPNLLEAGLTIVGRQVRVDGGPLDLLAVDAQGTWVVIELKRGSLYRDAITQALDYASSIASMPHDLLMSRVREYLNSSPSHDQINLQSQLASTDDDEELRDVRISLVGTSADPGTMRLSTYLATAHNVPITVVTFQVYEIEEGQRILLRELTDAETQPQPREPKSPRSIEAVCARADAGGVGVQFRSILKAAQERGLYPRPYKVSIMYTPPANRNRMLFTVWVRPQDPGLLSIYVGCEAFSEFYPVNPSEVATYLGPDGWRFLSESEAHEVVQGLNLLMDVIENRQQSETT